MGDCPFKLINARPSEYPERPDDGEWKLAHPQGCLYVGCEWWVEEKNMCSIKALATAK